MIRDRSRATEHNRGVRQFGHLLRAAGIVTATAAAIGVVAAATPVHADAPTEVPFSGSFTDVNACTDELDVYHVESTLYLHTGHAHNVVDLVDRHTGSTASGFELAHGRSTLVETGTNVRVTLMDLWEHPETGERLSVHLVFVLDLTDLDVRVDSFGARCLRTGS